ncbi:MAG TPA: type II toxin-antitoxin system prevent-host-death family antitoxin [Thermoanaerobaculia bacterium]
MAMTINELEKIAGSHTTRQASEVKSNWRSIVQEAKKQEVIVTNYNRPEAVVMSAERYAELQKAAKANDPMARLREEWDRRLAVLQTPESRERMMEWFNASPQEIADEVNAGKKKK